MAVAVTWKQKGRTLNALISGPEPTLTAFLDRGHVNEFGTHIELAARSGRRTEFLCATYIDLSGLEASA